jgi:ribosomal protein L3 glutamine methyltransferase
MAAVPPRPTVLPASNKVITELSTLRDCLRYAVSRFGQAGIFCGHGLPDVYDEAVYLAQWALHLPLDRLEPFLDAALSRDERAAVLALVDARCQRMPSFYLTGQAWLAGSKFICDKRALVPRSLIAEALSGSLSDWIETAPMRILDLCTGGGSIAILAALHWPECTVLASDISAPALQLADENIRMHQLRSRVTTCQSDLMASIAPTEFDLILCNPPYVNAQAMARLPAEFLAEPQGALAGGEDGMDLIRTILTQARGALNEHGAILLEIGHEAEHFEQAFPTLEFSYLPVTQGEQMLVWVTREQLLAGLHKPTLVDSSKPRAAKPPTPAV